MYNSSYNTHVTIPLDSNSYVSTFSKVSNNYNKLNQISSCIASTFHFNKEVLFSTEVTLKYLQFFNISELNIYFIDADPNFWKTTSSKNKHFIEPKLLNVYYISLDDFAECVISGEFSDKSPNSVFIFHNVKWSEVVLKCKLLNNDLSSGVSVSGGSSNKRHIISTLQSRLIVYVISLFNLDFNSLLNVNGFDTVDKRIFLPFADFTNNEFRVTIPHGKAMKVDLNAFLKNSDSDDNNNIETINDDNKLNTKNKKNGSKLFKNKFNINQTREVHSYRNFSSSINDKDSYIFTYLDNIEKLVHDHSGDYSKVQLDIEESWIDMIKNKIEDPNNSTWSKLPTILNKVEDCLLIANKDILPRKFKGYNDLIINCRKEIIIYSLSWIITNFKKMSLTNLTITLGHTISYILFKHSHTENSCITPSEEFKKWKFTHKLDDNNMKNVLSLGDFVINLFTNEPNVIFEESISVDEFPINNHKILVVSNEYIEMINKTLIVHPNSLPMLCKPLDWDDNLYGGFLKNSENKLDLIVGSKHHKHILENRVKLYKTVNKINAIEFSINTELLDYINGDGKYLLEDMDDNHKLQTNVTLRVADIYRNHPFYLNVNADWRGRIYTNSFFLSYQGGDLSRSLVQFSSGKNLNRSGKKYLYISGANFYSTSLSKSSIDNRRKWVVNNYDKIISLDKDFILKSSDKIQFLSFCLCLRNLDKNKKYDVKMPVFLDATCSGMQHLAAMIRDQNVGSLVNLIEKNDNDNVNDIYTSLVDPINKEINNFGKKKVNNMPNLKDVVLNRSILKTCIMTQVYNVKIEGIYRQLISKLEKVLEKSDKKKSTGVTYYLSPNKKGSTNKLSYKEVYKMATIIKNIVFVLHPSLEKIYDYFISITRLQVILNLPVVWITPSGLQITQNYSTSKTTKISTSWFGKSKTTVIKEWLDVVDKSKQSQAIIPNIIHSLDAAHLVNIINKCVELTIGDVITIHDCFGSHPNDMEKVSSVVRNEFVLQYSSEDFINKYHDRVLQNIKDNNYNIIEMDESKYVIKNNKKYPLPTTPNKGKLDLKNINKAIHMIN